ncbi:MAG: hypothetical protein HOH43_12285 [Candidatus Latescibacteria bacterium]|jgi:hypothetical protein|nr:hypothetical protein [Candidatus Latescibacterota bacterium]
MQDSNELAQLRQDYEALSLAHKRLVMDRKCDSVASVLKTFVKFGGTAGIMFSGYLILSGAEDGLVGSILLRYITQQPMGALMAWGCGLAGVLFGIQQLRLIRKFEARMRIRDQLVPDASKARPPTKEMPGVYHE